MHPGQEITLSHRQFIIIGVGCGMIDIHECKGLIVRMLKNNEWLVE
jgi:hypothetical protein